MSTFGDTTQDTTQDSAQDTAQSAPHAGPAGRPPLRRSYQGRMVAGVCAGIADYLAIDVTLVRVAFAVFTFLGAAGIPAYLACLLLIPEEGAEQSIAASLLDSVQRSL
jgi:phage shock protein PspC (stress-responsive transcriptional regulator)